MALATQCPHCHTTFRVAADQLKLRGDIVRCGACQRIFDGNAHLIDLDKPAAPPSQDTHDAGSDALPVYTLDFDHTFDPLGILP
ncbi:MAG: zinc-ribbon domain-containing protein, partial [Massilia sp.]|nr:zinc-ribbon domain-containing protein [Massilia sp.]